MYVQSILINKHKFNKEQALEYVKRMGYTPIKPAHEMLHNYRFRIHEPDIFEYFVSKKINDNVTIVFGKL